MIHNQLGDVLNAKIQAAFLFSNVVGSVPGNQSVRPADSKSTPHPPVIVCMYVHWKDHQTRTGTRTRTLAEHADHRIALIHEQLCFVCVCVCVRFV